ncbi:MAG: hypothetical protein AB8G18_16230 [Gammaproteobacteria bacterium]
MNKSTYVLLIVLAAFTGSSVSAADRPSLPKNAPKWLVKDMKKESRKKKLRRVKLADGAIEIQVTGKLVEPPEETDSGTWYLATNYGGEIDVNCWVITEPRYMYESLISTADNLLESTAELNDNAKIIGKENYYTETGYLEGYPHAAFERLIVLETKDKQQLQGLQKTRIAQREDVTFICSHTELGYIKTFEKMFKNLVLKAKINMPSENPYYEEQQLISMNGSTAGFAQIFMSLDADGDTKIYTETGMMVPMANGTLMVMDSSGLQYSHPDGRLINGVSASIRNGEFSHNLQFGRTEDDSWLVSGTEAGEEINHAISADEEPLSMLGQMFVSKKAIKQDEESSLTFPIWSPDVDSSVITTATLTTGKSKRGKTEALSVVGPLKMNVILDDSGSTISSVTEVPGASIQTQRFSMKGAVRSPE